MNKDEIMRKNINDCKNNDEYTIKIERDAYALCFFICIIIGLIVMVVLPLLEIESTVNFLGKQHSLIDFIMFPFSINIFAYHLFKYIKLRKKLNFWLVIFWASGIIAFFSKLFS